MKQPKIRYHLENKTEDRKKPELLMASISYGFKRPTKMGSLRSIPMKISLQCNVLPKHFGKPEDNYSFNPNVFKKYSSQNGHARTAMSLLEAAVDKLGVNYSINKTVPTPQRFKDDLIVEMGRKSATEEIKSGMVEVLSERIKYLEKIEGSNKKDAVSKGTIKGYRSLLLHLEDYEIATGRKLYFENFDELLYWQLWDITDEIYRGNLTVENPRHRKKRRTDSLGFATKSMQKYQKNLLAFLRVMKKEFTTELDLDNDNLVLRNTEARKSTSVTEQELLKILDTDLTIHEDLQAAKDFIVISALTGLRYEGVLEASETTIEEFAEDNYSFNYIFINLGKVGEDVIIPLMRPVMDIVERNGCIPKPSADINDSLKDLYRHLEFNNMEVYVRDTYKTGYHKSPEPKCEIISTHDGRRGFITNLDRHKVPKERVLNMTHPRSKKDDMFDLYNKSTLMDKAKDFVDEISEIDSEIYRF